MKCITFEESALSSSTIRVFGGPKRKTTLSKSACAIEIASCLTRGIATINPVISHKQQEEIHSHIYL